MSEFLKPQNIPAALMSQIRDAFDHNQNVVELRTKASYLQQQGHFVEAMAVYKQVQELYSHAIAIYLQDAEQENEKASLSTMEMPQDKRTHMIELTTAMILAIDVMETCVKEMDDIVKSLDKEVTFIGWREIRELAKAIRGKLEMVSKDAPFVNSNNWGDAADNLFEMTLHKARKVLRNDESQKKQNTNK